MVIKIVGGCLVDKPHQNAVLIFSSVVSGFQFRSVTPVETQLVTRSQGRANPKRKKFLKN